MQKEFKAMTDFELYEEVDRGALTMQETRAIIGSRWVLRWKGDEVRARFVARGFDERVEDKDLLFASTPATTPLRILLALALARNWSIYVGDISTAFMHAPVARMAKRSGN